MKTALDFLDEAVKEVTGYRNWETIVDVASPEPVAEYYLKLIMQYIATAYAKQALELAAERADVVVHDHYLGVVHRVNKKSILNIINELK